MIRYRYNLLHRLLHWATAICVIGLLIVGGMFWYLGFEGTLETFGKAGTNMLYMLHKSFGVVVLGLTLLRIVVKLTTHKPPYSVPLTDFERAASGAVHGLLYVALIAMPIFGWLYTAAGGFPVEFFGTTLPGIIGKDEALKETFLMLHGYTGLAILVFISIHIAAALRHWFLKQDGVIARMGF